MRALTTISILMITALCLFGQVPEKVSYQAVVRDAAGLLVSNSTVGMQISILQGSANGSAVYAETHSPVSNDNGLVTIEIGDGTAVSGTFGQIDWSDGPYFIKTETDPSGGKAYSISGTSQILSVPYALYAESAGYVDFTELDPLYVGSAAAGINEDDITGWDNKLDMEVDGDVSNELQQISREGSTVTLSKGGGSFTDSVNTYVAGEGIVIENFVISREKQYRIGDLHMGGIVFFVDPSGKHGLVASLDDLDGGPGVPWSDVTDEEIGDEARSATLGRNNTSAITGQQMATSAAQLCVNLGPGWYLPSNRELYLLFSQEIIIDQVLDNDGDDTTNGLNQEYDRTTFGMYWSSTERNFERAWAYKALSGDSSHFDKEDTYRVRAVRAF